MTYHGKPPSQTVRRIVDAHHHFWDLSLGKQPWLCEEPPISFRYGDYRALRRNYLEGDYELDARAAHVEVQGSVYVETEWTPEDPHGEVAYVGNLLSQYRLPTVVVAHVRLDSPQAADLLAHHASFPFVRSIRHKPRANTGPGVPGSGGMVDKAWRSGFAHLAKAGLRFDLQTPWWHMHEAAILARDFPHTPLIVNHAGLPADRSPEALAAWAEAMTRLSECPNIFMKISGIGMPGKPWTVSANRYIVEHLIEVFGIERCMFASNFPVDSLCGSFDEIFGGFGEIVANFSPDEQDALFRRNAIRIYDMGLPL